LLWTEKLDVQEDLDSLILNQQRTQRLPKRLCPIKNLMVDVFELISQSPKDPTLPPLGHTWEDQLTVEMTVEAVAEVVVAAAVTVEAMRIEVMVVAAAEVTVVAVEAADRPLLSIEAVPDGSIAHVLVLTHHVAIDSFLQSGPMNFCKKKSERTVESASVSISVYQNFGSCSERIRKFGSSQTIICQFLTFRSIFYSVLGK